MDDTGQGNAYAFPLFVFPFRHILTASVGIRREVFFLYRDCRAESRTCADSIVDATQCWEETGMQMNDIGIENSFAKPTGEEDREWVQRMIERGRGKTADDIQNISPHLQPYDEKGEKVWGLIPRRAEQNPEATAATQVQAILGVEREDCAARFDLVDYFWVGDNQGPNQTVMAFDLINMPMTDVKLNPLPKFIIPNALSGDVVETKNARQSLLCDSVVKSARLMLIKFDALTLEEQIAFWYGVLGAGTLRVVTLVHSGGKKIHALVEVEGEYASFKDRVLGLCCSAKDARYRCDPSVLHPSASTRLAGARRFDTGCYQEILFARCS